MELVRVALNGKQEKTGSAVAKSLWLLKKKAPVVRLVVSYADSEQGHSGIIYQATNWIYTGFSIDSNLIIDGEPLSSIRGTMILLLDLGLSVAEAITWLYELNSELGTEPITALLAGHKAPVRRAAQALG